MELKDTIEMMKSTDYKKRFKAEYYQTKIRYEKLKAFNTKIEAAHLNDKVEMPKHDCPDDLLRTQQALMGHYLHILEIRAEIEGITLDNIAEESGQNATIGYDYSKPYDFGQLTTTPNIITCNNEATTTCACDNEASENVPRLRNIKNEGAKE